jgi:hypothetical protein
MEVKLKDKMIEDWLKHTATIKNVITPQMTPNMVSIYRENDEEYKKQELLKEKLKAIKDALYSS